MVSTELPFDIVEVDKDLQEKQLGSKRYAFDGWIVGPKKYFLASSYKASASEIYNFEAREDDIYLTGFVRAGTTMHCEMVWLISNNLDYKEAQEKVLDERFRHIDEAALQSIAPQIPGRGCSLANIKNQRTRRFIKAHLPFSLLSPSIFNSGAKVIYCARNPKDVIVSCFHVYQFFVNKEEPMETFPEFFNSFKFNWYYFSPLFEHVKEAWAKRNDKNVLFLFYEDTMKDKRRTILKVAEFLNKKLTDEQIDGLLDHLSMDKFRKNKSVNLELMKDAGLFHKKEDFIRKGRPGGWRDYFVGDLAKDVDEWIAENLRGTDLKFPDV